MQSPELGFITFDDVCNAFTFELTRIESDYKRNGIPSDFKAIIEDIDCIRSQLLKRAKSNFEAYARAHPEVKKQEWEKKKAEDEKNDTRDWRDRVSENRKEAIREALRG